MGGRDAGRSGVPDGRATGAAPGALPVRDWGAGGAELGGTVGRGIAGGAALVRGAAGPPAVDPVAGMLGAAAAGRLGTPSPSLGGFRVAEAPPANGGGAEGALGDEGLAAVVGVTGGGVGVLAAPPAAPVGAPRPTVEWSLEGEDGVGSVAAAVLVVDASLCETGSDGLLEPPAAPPCSGEAIALVGRRDGVGCGRAAAARVDAVSWRAAVGAASVLCFSSGSLEELAGGAGTAALAGAGGVGILCCGRVDGGPAVRETSERAGAATRASGAVARGVPLDPERLAPPAAGAATAVFTTPRPDCATNSSPVVDCVVIAITPPHTEQRARTPPGGTRAGSTRKTE
jgi:hypothetical protein